MSDDKLHRHDAEINRQLDAVMDLQSTDARDPRLIPMRQKVRSLIEERKREQETQAQAELQEFLDRQEEKRWAQ